MTTMSRGGQIHPTEDMTGHAYNYKGQLQSRSSNLDASYHTSVTLEEARWSDMRKRIGLPRLPKRDSPQDEIDRAREEHITYVKSHFYRKECTKFVPKQNQKVEIVKKLKCHCGEVLFGHDGKRKNQSHSSKDVATSFHVPEEYEDLIKNERAPPPAKLPEVPWNADKNIKKLTTNAFGKIVFDVEQIGGTKPAKYIRLSDEDSAVDALDLMIKFWRIKEPVPPKLVISVIGGAKNFKLDGRMRDTFSNGLIKAAKTTSAWLITSGFNMGVMKAVGQAVHEGQTFQWDNDRMTHVLRCIGIAPWGYIKGRSSLESDGAGKFNAHYQTKNLIQHGQPVYLNQDHTHFIFVDDGMRNRYGGVAAFRAKFEKHVMSSQGLGIPVVLLVVEGGHDAITDASASLQHDIPVVVCSGTGRAADIFAYAYSKMFGPTGGKRYLKNKHREKLANKLFEDFGKSWGDKAETEKLRFAKLIEECCCKYEHRLVIFPINKHEDLDLAILKVLLKAQGGEKATDLRFNQLMLALTWNRADIAQEEIFREDVNWEAGHLDEAMTAALDQDKVDFVKLILNQGIIMKEYLTVQRLEKLYNSIPEHSHLFYLLQRFTKKAKESRFVLSDIGDFLKYLLDKYDDEMYSHDNDHNKQSSLSKPSSFRKKRLHETTDTDDEEVPKFKRPYKQLLIWAVLMNRVDLALFFWEMGEEPITSAVAVTRLCLGMMKKIPSYQTRIRQEFEDMKQWFESLAICVLDECNAAGPDKAMMLVERKSLMWSKMSSLQMAASAQDRAFLSSVACQNSINTTWKHGILSNYKKVLLGILFPPFIYNVEVGHLGEKKVSILQKLLTFYTAPMTKFGSYSISYLIFLGLFSYLVLVDYKETPTVVEWICIVWNFTFLTGEIHTFVCFPIPTWRGKIRDWFGLPNILDASNLLAVFVGFGLRWSQRFFFEAKVIYCFNVIIFYLRILKVYTANSQLGPKLIMIRRMLEELILFVMVLLVFLLAYGVASQGLLYPQRSPSQEILKDIVYYPYWQLYGEIFLEEIQSDDACIAALANGTELSPLENTCRTSNWMVSILLAAYLCVGNILLLNLLIAIFSHVFDTVEENSMVIWKYQMYYLVMEYDIKSSIIAPFNLIKHVYLLVKWIFRKTCCKKETEGVPGQYTPDQLMYLQLFEKEMMANYLRHHKSSSVSKLETKIDKLQKKVEELTKLIEDADEDRPDLDMMNTTMYQQVAGQQTGLPPTGKEKKKLSRWPSPDRVVALGKKERREAALKEVEEAMIEEKLKFEDVVMDEVKKKHKKKKHKKEKERKKKRERRGDEEEKELNINLNDYESKPDYSHKHVESDSSPTRGHHRQVPRSFPPLSPRTSFLQSRSEQLPLSDSEDDIGRLVSPYNRLNINTMPLSPALLSPDQSDEDNYSRSPRGSKLTAIRRARKRHKGRSSEREDRF